MMYQHSPITTRLFLILLVLIGSIFGSIYQFTVPLIKENVFNLELHANRQVLNIVYDLANRMYSSTETYVDTTLQSHQQRLDSIVDVVENRINNELEQGRSQGMPETEIWQTIFSGIRQISFGNNDYLWLSDYDANMLAHPSDQFHQRDMSEFTDPDGTIIIPKLLRLARKDGRGFYRYKWQRLNGDETIDKYSYVRDYPQWNFVIGAGVYIDDIQQEVQSLKQQAILEINAALENVKIAENGYLFVFDAQGNMLFHPNPNIHGINFKRQLNPVTQNPIYQDLIAVADTETELYYKWDKPADQGNYQYEKLSLVRHLSGFDWYISSSVYLDDLKVSSAQLSQRIIAAGFLGLIATVLAAFLFAQWLTSPIKKLSLTAYKISRGNLLAKTRINRNDEIGSLAESFDLMVDQLRDNINNLNSRVKSRTRELSTSNQQLQQAVTSLERAQTELTTVEHRQRMILDALPAQVAYLDRNLRVVFANRQYRYVFEHNKEDIQNKKLVDVIGKTMYHDIKPYFDQAFQGECPVYEYQLRVRGHDIITRRTVMPILDLTQHVTGFLTLSIDITRERNAEKQILEASKMKAVGQMSGGLAHDFNNLLTIILGNLLQLQNKTLHHGDSQINLAPAIRATRRGADMTKRLLAFSRKQALLPTRINPEHLINDLVDLLVAPLPENIKLRTQIQSNISDLYVDAAQIEDALVNLALNSADAMPAGGELKIQVSSVDWIDPMFDKTGFDEPIKSGDYLMISVLDTGVGFSQEALKKACEPFYTTKLTGAGSGLGLSMVYGFVKQSKGYLRIKNRTDEQQGANIELLLPIATEVQRSVEKPEIKPIHTFNRPLNSNLILLVEDNLDLRSLVRQQLTASGFIVIEAASGDEALVILSGIEQLAGVVSDVVMPGATDGYAMAKAVKTLYPEAFVVLMTGYSEIIPQTDFELTLLHKPFDPQVLTDLLPNNKKGSAH